MSSNLQTNNWSFLNFKLDISDSELRNPKIQNNIRYKYNHPFTKNKFLGKNKHCSRNPYIGTN